MHVVLRSDVNGSNLKLNDLLFYLSEQVMSQTDDEIERHKKEADKVEEE